MIETERLILRRWRDADREPFATINADPRTARYLPSTLNRAESDAMIDRLEAHIAEHGFGFWAAELKESGKLVGCAGLLRVSFEAHFTPAVEIGWRISPEHWNRGLATEGARAALEAGFRDLGLEEIVSFTVQENTASRRVMEKLGMHHEPAGDFDHPKLPDGHPLRRHVLYRISREAHLPK